MNIKEDQPIKCGKYIIYSSDAWARHYGWNYYYRLNDNYYDGEVLGLAKSIEEAREDIDELTIND